MEEFKLVPRTKYRLLEILQQSFVTNGYISLCKTVKQLYIDGALMKEEALMLDDMIRSTLPFKVLLKCIFTFTPIHKAYYWPIGDRKSRIKAVEKLMIKHGKEKG